MTVRAARRAPILVAAVVVVALAAFYRPQSYGVWGDQMTYYLQADSLAFDGDLQFDRRDLERFRSHGWPEKNPVGLFLREAGARFYYSKPFLYSLAAAPFVWVCPVRGLIVLNAVLWLILLEITFRWWRRFNGLPRAAAVSLLAWAGSAAPFYIFIIHTDLMVPVLLALALYLWLTSKSVDSDVPAGETRDTEGAETQDQSPNPDRSMIRLVLSGVFFGLALYEKNPTVFFLAAACGSLLWRRELKAALLLGTVATITFCLPTAVHVAQNGKFSPYQGRRVYCGGDFPFDDLEKARVQLAEHRHPGGEFFEPRRMGELLGPANLRRFATTLPTKTCYFFVGRKTGLFPYLTPALIAIVLWLALGQWRGERGRDTPWIAAGLCAYVLFYFFILSAYYGGPTAIGNRYALQVFPAFLLLVQRFPKPRIHFAGLIAAFAAAALFFPGPDLLKPYGKVRDSMEVFQKPRFRWLPFEWHLAWFMSDQSQATIALGPMGRVLRLTDLNPTLTDYAYFTPSPRHRVALLSPSRLEMVAIRLAAHSQPQTGWLRGGKERVAFSLKPYETRVYRVPLSQRCHALYRDFDVYCYRIEIVTTSPLEPNRLYPKDYYEEFGPFVQWISDLRQPSPTAGLVPDDLSDSGPLLWGWHAVEPPDSEGRHRRWSGDAIESAAVIALAPEGDCVLQVKARCPLPIETEAVWNGQSVGRCVIGPAPDGAWRWTIPAALLREGDNLLTLRHGRLWIPAALPEGAVIADKRELAVHYESFTVEPARAPSPPPAPEGAPR